MAQADYSLRHIWHTYDHISSGTTYTLSWVPLQDIHIHDCPRHVLILMQGPLIEFGSV